VADLLYVEAVGNYVKVCRLREGVVQTDMLRATSKQIEDELRDYPMVVRCHRAFLVNLAQVEQVVSHAGSMQLMIKHSHDAIPVSRSNMTQVKEAIKEI
jgi:DNA-binding LytR/AlgR family response regulator